MQPKHYYEFGPFRLDPAEHQLSRGGEHLPLTPKAFETLLLLVQNSGRLVEREKLMKEVWPDSFVEEANLDGYISKLRKVLGEGRSGPHYIETVPKLGYRFVAAVQDVQDGIELIVKEHTRMRIVTEEEEQVAQRDKAEEAIRQPATRPKSIAEQFSVEIRRHQKGVILVVAVLIPVIAGIALLYSNKSGKAIDSVAVLPFTKVNADPDTEYFCDGIVESLIDRLSQLPDLKVMSRNSVFRYKGRETDAQAVGHELNVRAVLTGKIMQRGDTFSISAELVDAQDNSHIWGGQYNLKLTDTLAVQEEMANAISKKLRPVLTGEEQRRLTRRYTENTEAYQAYLKGRYYWNQRNEVGLKKGVEYFQQAIEIDPTYSVAYSGLADSYTTLGYFSYLAPEEAFPKAKAAATKALELDSTLAEPHTSLAYAKLYYDWDFSDAEREFKRALEINPYYATAHHWYSVYLTAMGRPDEALTEIRRAQELDPLSLITNTDIGFELYYNRQYDQAIKQLQMVLEMKPDFPLAHLWLGRSYQQKARYEEAIAEYQKVEAVFRNWAVAIAAIGYVDGVSGKKDEARKVLDELRHLSKQQYVTSYGMALVYAGLGEQDEAFQWLERAYEERSHWLVWLKLDPRWDGMRSDPRFQDLVRRVGLDR